MKLFIIITIYFRNSYEYFSTFIVILWYYNLKTKMTCTFIFQDSLEDNNLFKIIHKLTIL